VHLPVALNMTGCSALIIGEGVAAADKAAYLADFGVQTVVLVAPDVDVAPPMQDLADNAQISVRRSTYEAALLDGYSLIIIATGDSAQDRSIATDARRCGAIVNVVDDPDVCDVFATAYVKRGPVSIAVSTGGRSPAFAAALRENLDRMLSTEIDAQLRQYVVWRDHVKDLVPSPAAREQLWRELRGAGLYDVFLRDGARVASRLVDEAIARHAGRGPGGK